MLRLLVVIGVLLMITSCEKEVTIDRNTAAANTVNYQNHNPYYCNSPSEAEAGQLYRHEGKTWLWGGHEEGEDFEVTNWFLDIKNLKSGLGRELIKALTFPIYEKPAQQKIQATDKVIVVKGAKEVRLYTYDLLTQHELVNEVIDGQAILIGYCPLADLGVVYKRTYCNTDLIFALSGYTYLEKDEKGGSNNIHQNGDIQSFILWDRNTESLWYPYRNVAVSGKMQNQKLKYYDRDKWELTTFGEAVEQYGNQIQVLSYHQPNADEPLTYLDSEAVYCN